MLCCLLMDEGEDEIVKQSERFRVRLVEAC